MSGGIASLSIQGCGGEVMARGLQTYSTGSLSRKLGIPVVGFPSPVPGYWIPDGRLLMIRLILITSWILISL